MVGLDVKCSVKCSNMMRIWVATVSQFLSGMYNTISDYFLNANCVPAQKDDTSISPFLHQ